MSKYIYNNKLVLFLMILFFFKPICFQYYSSLVLVEDFFVLGKILAAVFFTTFSVLSIKKIKISFIKLNVAFFEVWLLFITLWKHEAVFRAFIDAVTIIVLVLFVWRGISKYPCQFIVAFYNVIIVLVFCQMISEIVYPSGMPADLYTNNKSNPLFFVTLDNGTSNIVCMGMLLTYLKQIILPTCGKKRVVAFYLPIIMCGATAYLSGSTTGIISYIFFLICLILVNNYSFEILDKRGFWISMYIVLFCAIMIPNTPIQTLAERLTGKTSYTGRTTLWMIAINKIKEAPLTGYGRWTVDYLQVWGGRFSSHNVVLEILLQGGLIALSSWIGCIISGYKMMSKNSSASLRKIIYSAISVLLIVLMMESKVHSPYLFSVLAIAYACENKNGLVE